MNFIVPGDTLAAITEFLVTCPWKDANPLILLLQQAQPVTEPEPNHHEPEPVEV